MVTAALYSEPLFSGIISLLGIKISKLFMPSTDPYMTGHHTVLVAAVFYVQYHCDDNQVFIHDNGQRNDRGMIFNVFMSYVLGF